MCKKAYYLCCLTQVFILSALLSAWPAAAQRSFDTDILADTFGFDADTKKSVALVDLHQGCPARDCISSIDNPQYIAAADATHVADDDIVLALSWNGEHRAYPARILDHHEIVNDVIGGTPLAITWCPLCGSAVGVKRDVAGQITEFGVSGMLYESNLVFYDRATDTLWDQVSAKGIVGPLTDTPLELVPITMTRWSRWKDAHPDTLVLSTDTGFDEDYSQDYYAKYREEDRLFMPVSASSDAVHAKTVIYGFEVDGKSVAFTENFLEQHPQHEYRMSEGSFRISIAADGAVQMVDNQSDAKYMPVRLFWFSWFTFHPDTDLVK
jgi:hypothetical protein